MGATLLDTVGHKIDVLISAGKARRAIKEPQTIERDQYWRQTPYERKEHVSDHTRFLISPVGLLFLSLIFSCAIQALGFILDIKWLAYDGLPVEPTATCTTQAVTLQLGNVGSSLTSLLIGVYLFSVLVLAYKPSLLVIRSAFALLFIGVTLLSVLGPALADPKIPFYGNAGKWCWITPHYKWQRLFFYYFLILLCGGVNSLLYAGIIARMVKNRRTPAGFHVSDSTSAKVARMVLLFPLVFIILGLPSCVYRLGQLAGHSMPGTLAEAAAIMYGFSGVIYCIVYLCTRRMLATASGRSETQETIFNRGHQAFDLYDEGGMTREEEAFGVTLEKGASAVAPGRVGSGMWKWGARP
ncbi:integral membrane protein, glucose receptor Git3 [Pseudohyphozyma bogoriensis]|nr:integral membrane protein, glucose receptor Git3 [Pseudohyphozyma bogoriensis]